MKDKTKRPNKKNSMKENKKYPYKKYYCSKHKGNGNPNCKECWDNLNKLVKDNNGVLIQ